MEKYTYRGWYLQVNNIGGNLELLFARLLALFGILWQIGGCERVLVAEDFLDDLMINVSLSWLNANIELVHLLLLDIVSLALGLTHSIDETT